MPNISERPVEVKERAASGRLEGDLIVGKGNEPPLGTPVEHNTRLVIFTQSGRDSRDEAVCGANAWKMLELPEMLRKSLAWHQGSLSRLTVRRRPMWMSPSRLPTHLVGDDPTRTITGYFVSTCRKALSRLSRSPRILGPSPL